MAACFALVFCKNYCNCIKLTLHMLIGEKCNISTYQKFFEKGKKEKENLNNSVLFQMLWTQKLKIYNFSFISGHTDSKKGKNFKFLMLLFLQFWVLQNPNIEIKRRIKNYIEILLFQLP